jgi:hypothetical protein
MDWQKILSQIVVVKDAPVPFFVALLVLAGIIWTGMDWRYASIIAQRDGIIANRDSEISLLKGERDGYKDKLSGATPDQAKARIDALEARLAAVEPRKLTADQRAVEATACEADQLVGLWKCSGQICTAGADVSEFARNDDGSYRWVDGKKNVGTVQVHNVSVTVFWPQGQMSGTLTAGCRQIRWVGDHVDTKQ